jgi:hypothetical protein
MANLGALNTSWEQLLATAAQAAHPLPAGVYAFRVVASDAISALRLH